MNTYSSNTNESKSHALTNKLTQRKSTSAFIDNRPEAVMQRQLQEMAGNNPQSNQIAQFQQSVSKNTHSIQKKENKTGLPDNLKSGIENLSGHSMDDVKVHYNSSQPATLQAHAYAQGTNIHVASGQEKHLAHEAWHVVQQKQGRVKPTMQMKGGVNVNDDAGLEKEADMMGSKAMLMSSHLIPAQKESYSEKTIDDLWNGDNVIQGAAKKDTGCIKTITQLRPDNFYRSYRLPMYKDKFDGFKGERSGQIAKPLNALKSKEIIASRPFIGGHLLKAEFGGEDVRDNVVPWIDSAESKFGNYESTYKNRITRHYDYLAKHKPEELDNGKWEWTFHLAVQYKDRDEQDFPIDENHNYTDTEKNAIYSQLSEIPSSVMVNPGNTLDFYTTEGKEISGDIKINKKSKFNVLDIITPQKQASSVDLTNIVDHYVGRFSNNLDLLISKGDSYLEEFKNEDWIDEFKNYWYQNILACLDEVLHAIDKFPDQREDIQSPKEWLLTNPLYYTRRTELEALWGISKSWNNMRKAVLENPVEIERKSLVRAQYKVDNLITKFIGYLKNTIFDFNEKLNSL